MLVGAWGLEPQTPTVSRCGRDQLVADREGLVTPTAFTLIRNSLSRLLVLFRASLDDAFHA